jgi:hypothetical protein
VDLVCGLAVQFSVVALPQAPVVEDREIGALERDLGRLNRAVEVRHEHCCDSVVPPTLTQLPSESFAAPGKSPAPPTSRESPIVVLGQ